MHSSPPIRIKYENNRTGSLRLRYTKVAKETETSSHQSTEDPPIRIGYDQDVVRRRVSTVSAMIPPQQRDRNCPGVWQLKLSTRIAAYIMDQPLSAATKSTLLAWILWSVDANDSNLGE